MPKTLLERVEEKREAESAAKFANHVQSIAFNLTLSRSMIEGLGLLFHWGYISDNLNQFVHKKPPRWQASDYLSGHSVPVMNALIRRGLVTHHTNERISRSALDSAELWGHQSYRLTRAGIAVCDLLVIAGLMEAKQPEKKRKRA